MKEQRFTPRGLAVEIREDGGPRQIRGVAAVFYDGTPTTEYKLWANTYERIMPGAFDRAVEEGDDVRALFNHDSNFLLGRTKAKTLELSVEPDGLHYSVSPGASSVHRDVEEMILRGDLDGSSFGFQIEDERWLQEEEDEIREINSVRLFDVSPVTFPAYDATSVGFRAFGDVSEAKASRDRAKRETLGRIRERRQLDAESRDRILRIITYGMAP
jgi:HK97 family phage prohead protease